MAEGLLLHFASLHGSTGGLTYQTGVGGKQTVRQRPYTIWSSAGARGDVSNAFSAANVVWTQMSPLQRRSWSDAASSETTSAPTAGIEERGRRLWLRCATRYKYYRTLFGWVIPDLSPVNAPSKLQMGFTVKLMSTLGAPNYRATIRFTNQMPFTMRSCTVLSPPLSYSIRRFKDHFDISNRRYLSFSAYETRTINFNLLTPHSRFYFRTVFIRPQLPPTWSLTSIIRADIPA